MRKVRLQSWKGLGFALLFLAGLPLGGEMGGLTAQAISFQVGNSRSWGQDDGVFCDASGCYPGSVQTHGDLEAVLYGIGVDFWRHRFFWLESGGILTKKGWTRTGPKLDTGYLQVPLVLHVGYMPSSTGLGLSVAGGGYLDAVIPELSESRPGVTSSAQLHLRLGDRVLSGGIRYSRNLRKDFGFYVRTWSYFLSFSPHY